MDLKLREWRKARKMTLQDVAGELETNVSQISRLESGGRRLNADWIERLAKLYACTPDELVAGPQILDEAERNLLEDFRALPAEQQSAIAKTIGELAAVNKSAESSDEATDFTP